MGTGTAAGRRLLRSARSVWRGSRSARASILRRSAHSALLRRPSGTAALPVRPLRSALLRRSSRTAAGGPLGSGAGGAGPRSRAAAISGPCLSLSSRARSLRTRSGCGTALRGASGRRAIAAGARAVRLILHAHCSVAINVVCRVWQKREENGIASLFCPQGAIYIQRRKICAFGKDRHNSLQSKPEYPSRYNKYYITQTLYF